ncbi:MAG: hypothetical protein ACRDJE_21695 [Dehalococcoidia bacterium]
MLPLPSASSSLRLNDATLGPLWRAAPQVAIKIDLPRPPIVVKQAF